MQVLSVACAVAPGQQPPRPTPRLRRCASFSPKLRRHLAAPTPRSQRREAAVTVIAASDAPRRSWPGGCIQHAAELQSELSAWWSASVGAAPQLARGRYHAGYRSRNALAPSSGIVVQNDVPYLPGPRHMLDVYALAQGNGPADRPVVVFFCGEVVVKTADFAASIGFVGAELAAMASSRSFPTTGSGPEAVFPASCSTRRERLPGR